MHCDEHGTLDYCPKCTRDETIADLERQLQEAQEAISKGYRDSFGNWVIPLEFVNDYLDSTAGEPE